MKTNYKPEIDGLRAIAIIFVTLYYAKFIFFQNLYFSDATTIKKIKAITIGDVKLPSNIPNFVQILFNGVKRFEFIKPRIKNINEVNIDHVLIWFCSNNG